MLIGAAVAMWPAAARGQEVGLVVYPIAGAPSSADEVRAALARAVERAGGRVEGRPFSRAAELLAAGSVRAGRLEAFARAERLSAEGWRGYLEARFADSAARLEEARAAALSLLDLPGGAELVADVSLRLGAVRLALGRERDAGLDLQLAARLDPARAVTDAEFKPRVVERFQRERAARARRPRRIEVHPRGAQVEAQVEVDGRAAATSLELEEGAHVVLARAPGWAARAVVIEVAAGGAEVVRIELAADPLAAAIGRGGAGMRIGSRRAAEAAAAVVMVGELDGVLMAASVWRSGRPALLGQFCGGAPLACGRVVEVEARTTSLDRGATELWRAVRPTSGAPLVLLSDARLVHRESGPGVARAGEERSWWQSRWLWLGVGGAAVSAAAAALVLSGGGGDAWTASFGECDFGGC